MAGVRTFLKLIGACVLTGVLVAGILFPTVGGLGLLSNRASDTVQGVSSQLASGQVAQTSVMLDKNGNPIAYLWGDQRRTEVAADQISEAMKSAIVSIEDRRFYQHDGVDYRGTARAFVNNSAGNDTQGASTLTQQYVKNYLLLVVARTDAERRAATETTSARKLREIRIALDVDEQLGKEEVLTRYLNIVPFGNGAYGIQEAAQTYFGVNALDLTVTQSAMLAGMVQSSSALNPYTRPEAVTERRNLVLDTMLENQIITEAETTTFKAAPLGVLGEPKVPTNGCIGAGDRGFFCDYALQYLAGAGLDPDAVRTGGLTIRTTLDPAVQDAVKAAVNSEVPADVDGIANVMTTIQPGQDKHRVLAMATSRTYGLDGAALQTVVQQPYGLTGDGAGSIFKVFTTAAAMEQGLGINAQLPVPPTYVSEVFSGGAESCPDGPNNTTRYCVSNSGSYPDRLSVTDALARSPNTTFVQLLETATVASTVDMAQRLGLRSYGQVGAPGSGLEGTGDSIASQTVAQNQGSFTLGPKPVNVTELSNVAATIASSGVWCPPSPIESVTDSTGAPVPVTEQACEQVVPAGLADTLFNAMSRDDQPGGTAAAAARIAGWDTSRALGGKTGTTQNQSSSAFLGMTNTLASANLTFVDKEYSPVTDPDKQEICDTGDNGVRLCGNGTIFGGRVPARTFFRALIPVVDAYGPTGLPPIDPAYADGSDRGNVPSVVGQGASSATAELEGLGFRVQQASTSGGARGTVLRQSITGASVPGATITIYVSSGGGGGGGGGGAGPAPAPAPAAPADPAEPALPEAPPAEAPAPAEQAPPASIVVPAIPRR